VRRRTSIAIGAVLAIALVAPAASARSRAAGGAHDPLGAGHAFAVAYQRSHGYLPVGTSFAAYERNVTKRQDAWARTHPGAYVSHPAAGGAAPVAGPSWQGLDENDLAPPDSTGAIGPHSYIEFINDQMGIYNRNGALVSSAGTEAFAAPGGAHTDYSDPQILFDTFSQRFYYLIIDTAKDTFAWGFSKSNNPATVTSGFCNYEADFGYGSNLPDYPKLGQSRDFLLIGANIYAVEVYLGSDIDWITKPQGQAPITTCPAASSFHQGQQTAIENSDGSTFASDPNPAVAADVLPTGWVIAIPDETNSGATGNFLTLFRVTKNPNGTANIPKIGTQVSVAQFAPPPPAPQSGSAHTIDTLDGRLTHAMSGKDPLHRNHTMVWTSHTVQGGAGAEVRWYEIDTTNATAVQSGAATDASLFAYDGGISSDREARNKRIHKFGADMVLGFTTSSGTTDPAIQMVSKIGAGAQSAFVLVKQSPGPDDGFDCFELQRCRWGDYLGATPDPVASIQNPTGRVWLSGEWVNGQVDPLNATWRTWNWQATP
jgi:hypothetical protein